MAGCVSGKKMYATQEQAEDVLIHAWSTYEYAPGRGPVAVYKCDDCRQFHLTSSGEMNPRLAEQIRDGKIKLQKEANRWLDKFKKRG
jgi:hypothetical protein